MSIDFSLQVIYVELKIIKKKKLKNILKKFSNEIKVE